MSFDAGFLVAWLVPILACVVCEAICEHRERHH